MVDVPSSSLAGRPASPATAAARRLMPIIVAGATWVGCVGDTPPNAVAAPDIGRLTVFFPIDEGLVNGRYGPGPKPASFEYVFIRPHPSRNVYTVTRLQPDGSFTFRVAAAGDDILEIAFAEGPDDAAKRGAPTFIQVPPRTATAQSFFCCRNAGAASGRCQETSEPMCRGMSVFPTCTDDSECAFLSGDSIGIRPTDFSVTQPDAEGEVTITSNNPAYALHLVRFENRGQRAVGGPDPRTRDYVIADEQGRASAKMTARGDDEIVVRVFNIDGYTKSREHALYVPDADFAGVDVVGVFPFEGLQADRDGTIGVRFAPYGVDQRGICAPSNEPGPVLCFSGGHEAPGTGRNTNFNGGLDYDQVTQIRLTLDGQYEARITAPSLEERAMRNTKFTDGDILAPPQAVVLIIDHSAESNRRDGRRARFRAAENFLLSARGRDQIAVIATGDHADGAVGAAEPDFALRSNLANRADALRALLTVEGREVGGGNDIYGAVAAAGNLLALNARDREGSIVIISSSNPINDPATFDAALVAITGDDGGRDRFPVYTVALPICDDRSAMMASCTPLPSERRQYESLSGFTAGRFFEIATSDDFLTSVATVTGVISGAFVLQYEVRIPSQVRGKTANVRLDVTLRLPDPLNPVEGGTAQEQRTSYEGIIELRDNLAN